MPHADSAIRHNPDRTVHAETGYAEVVRYDRAGAWHVESKPTGVPLLNWRTRMPLPQIVEWITEQPQDEVTYYFGRRGGLQFDKRVRAELERIGDGV